MDEESNELVPVSKPNFAVTKPENYDEILRLAKMMVHSGFFKNSEDIAQAGVKIIAGQELGLSPVTSMMGIHFVKGKLTYEASLMASAIKRRGYSYKPIRHTDTECEIAFFSDSGEEIGTSLFTIEDAVRAGLASKDNWVSYPRNMLWARTMANGCRWYCSDIFGGPVHTPEELGADVDVNGAPTQSYEPQKVSRLNKRMNHSDVEETDEMNVGGTYPAVSEEA